MTQLEGTPGAGQEAGAHRAGEAIVTPLRKRRLTGELYERDPKIEAAIAELAVLPRDELIARAAITKRSDSGYVSSESLVYFIRASRHDNNEMWFERLYRILTERVLRSLPRTESSDSKTESLTRGVGRDKVFGRFVELLSADRAAYVDKVDYFEVRSYDPFDMSDFDDPAYRSRLDAAIDAVPTEQSRIIHMLRKGRRLRLRPWPESDAQLLQQAGWQLHGLPSQDDELREHHRGPGRGAEARRDSSHLPRAGSGGGQCFQLCRDRLRPCRDRRSDREAGQRAGCHHRPRRHRRLRPGLRRQNTR